MLTATMNQAETKHNNFQILTTRRESLHLCVHYRKSLSMILWKAAESKWIQTMPSEKNQLVVITHTSVKASIVRTQIILETRRKTRPCRKKKNVIL